MKEVPKRIEDQGMEGKPPSIDELIDRDPLLEMSAELTEHFATEIISRFMEKGFSVYENPNDVYNKDWGELYVRRESPQRLMKAISNDGDISLRFDGTFGEKYLNAAVWSQSNPEPMRWAIIEGFSKSGGIFMVETFSKDAPDIEEHKLDIPPETMMRVLKGGEVMNRYTFRSLSGDIHPDDMKFFIMGVVGHRFPKDQLTEDEQDRLEDYEIETEEWEAAGSDKKSRPDPIYIVRAFMRDQAAA